MTVNTNIKIDLQDAAAFVSMAKSMGAIGSMIMFKSGKYSFLASKLGGCLVTCRLGAMNDHPCAPDGAVTHTRYDRDSKEFENYVSMYFGLNSSMKDRRLKKIKSMIANFKKGKDTAPARWESNTLGSIKVNIIPYAGISYKWEVTYVDPHIQATTALLEKCKFRVVEGTIAVSAGILPYINTYARTTQR